MKVLVTVLPKDEVSDPQGEAIHDATSSLGFPEIRSVRAGRSFLLDCDAGVSDARLRELSDKLLANPIVEKFSIEVLERASK
jgi:phosphoribosylformylglycinamidine synthase